MTGAMLPLHLDLRHYETVFAVVETGSVTRAAEALAITQSAASHRLAEAERRLGVSLFTRGADRRVTPTGHGLAVHQVAGRAMADLRRVEESIVGSDGHPVVTVRVAVAGYDAYHWFPSFLASVRAGHPDIELDLVPTGDAVASALASRSVDLVVALGEPEGDVERIPLLDDELVLVCAPDHDLASRAVVEASDLVDETQLTYNAQPYPGFEYDRFIRPSAYAPRIVRVVRQTAAIVELVSAGAGVSILSRWATGPAVAAGRLATARCGRDGLAIPWCAAIRPSDTHARLVASLLAAHLS